MTDHESVVRRLREANPVPFLAALPVDDLQAVRALLDRRRGKMTATSTAAQAAPRWRRPALVLGAAFVVTLAAVGTTLLLLRRGEEAPPVVTTTLPPTTTLPVTTTTPTTTTTEGTISVEAWSYPADAVPPFHATIAWDRNPESNWRIGYEFYTLTPR